MIGRRARLTVLLVAAAIGLVAACNLNPRPDIPSAKGSDPSLGFGNGSDDHRGAPSAAADAGASIRDSGTDAD